MLWVAKKRLRDARADWRMLDDAKERWGMVLCQEMLRDDKGCLEKFKRCFRDAVEEIREKGDKQMLRE